MSDMKNSNTSSSMSEIIEGIAGANRTVLDKEELEVGIRDLKGLLKKIKKSQQVDLIGGQEIISQKQREIDDINATNCDSEEEWQELDRQKEIINMSCPVDGVEYIHDMLDQFQEEYSHR